MTIPYDLDHQFYQPQTMVLLGTTTASGVLTASTTFQVRTPDSRLRTKIGLLFVPTDGGSHVISAAAPTLWLYEGEEDISGATGVIVNGNNIEGTQAAPTAIIPVGSGLTGYAREFVTSADWIVGTFTTSSNGFTSGAWYLKTRYQPDAVRFDPKEWDAIIRKTAMINTGGVFNI
jgi:hypothetical protein